MENSGKASREVSVQTKGNGETLENPGKENRGFFNDLKDRRVPQIIGVYLAASWGIIQFIDWIVNRYQLSPNYTTLALVILFSLIPSSIIVAYYHGRPGKNKWRKSEVIGIPVNVLVTAFLVFTLFGGEDLGTMYQKVSVKEESGKTVQRAIPKAQYRKKILLFNFKNKTNDASQDWLQHGLTAMLEFDLSQDLYLTTNTPFSSGIKNYTDYFVYKRMKKAGYKDAVGLPLLLKKKISSEVRMDYFLTGELTREGKQFAVEYALYHTHNAKLINKKKIQKDGVFKLIDELSLSLRHDLEIPRGYIKENNDLPISETFTNSLTAARLYTNGIMSLIMDQNWLKAQKFFEEAVKEDPTFAVAYSHLSVIYLFNNLSDKRLKIVQELSKYSYKLPESMQLYTKIGYYQLKSQWEKINNILEMINKLYPEDIKAYSIRAIMLSIQSKYDEAIACYRKILEIDATQYDTLKDIGKEYEKKGQPDKALSYYEKFAAHFPTTPETFRLLGGFHNRSGNFEKAREYYEKILLLNPEDIGSLTKISNIQFQLGNMEQALNQAQSALELSKTPREKALVYRVFKAIHETMGQTKKALEYNILQHKAMEKYQSPLVLQINKIGSIGYYIKAGKQKEVFRQLKQLERSIKPPYDKVVQSGYILAYIELKKPDEAAKYLPGLKELVKEIKTTQYKLLLHYAEGNIHRLNGQYRKAIASFEKRLKEIPMEDVSLYFIAKCYRHLKEYKKAEEFIVKRLSITPFEPLCNYEAALIYEGLNNKEKMLEHLERAVMVWQSANPEFEPALAAKEKLRLEIKN